MPALLDCHVQFSKDLLLLVPVPVRFNFLSLIVEYGREDSAVYNKNFLPSIFTPEIRLDVQSDPRPNLGAFPRLLHTGGTIWFTLLGSGFRDNETEWLSECVLWPPSQPEDRTEMGRGRVLGLRDTHLTCKCYYYCHFDGLLPLTSEILYLLVEGFLCMRVDMCYWHCVYACPHHY